jgi:CRISPR/Cas system-associated protein Csm6
MAKLNFVVFKDKENADEWRVEAVDAASGEVYIAIFAGNNSEARAVEYASLKNGVHPIFEKAKKVVPLPPVSPAPIVKNVMADTLIIMSKDKKTNKDIEARIRPNDMDWTFDVRRGTCMGKMKKVIERITVIEKEGKE